MIKRLIFILVFLAMTTPGFAALKITELAEDLSPSSDDLIVTVNDPEGTPASRKVSITNTESVLESLIDLQDLQGAVTDDQVPNNITITNATTATALAANGTNASSGNAILGVDASGNAEGSFDVATQTELDAAISDTAYDATTWNGDTTHAPSKNAVRDKIESLGAGGGDSVSIDSSGVTDPDFVSTGDIDFVNTSNTVTANLNSEAIVNADVNASAAIDVSKTALSAGAGLTLSTNTLNSDGQVVGTGHATNQTASFSCSITGICGTSTTMQALQKWPMTGAFSNLYAVVSTAPGAGKSWTITVYVNNSSTSLTCQITDANTSCSDTSNSASITAAQSVDVRWTAAGSPSGTVAVFFTSKFVPS